jgi:ribosomal 50S subunit-associated protein YjgA (DUF615 family)
MAPSAVETTSETQAAAAVPKLLSNLPIADRGYARLFDRNFDKETEEGKNGHPAAKVRHCWVVADSDSAHT